MNLSPKRRLHSFRSALGLGLAALAAAVATAEPASAQRRSHGDVWQATGTRVTQQGRAAISVGSEGASFRASYGQRGRNGGTNHGTHRDFRRGHYTTRSERYWVPGFDRQVWVPPVFEWRYDFCGNRSRVQVRAGFYRTECVPGHYATRSVQVWVPAQRVTHRVAPRTTHRDSHAGHRRDRVTHVGRRYRR